MAGMIASIQQAVAPVGREVLARGGNAVDAAVAAGFAECVVSPSLVSIGGVANLHIYHGPSKGHFLYQGGGQAGSNARADTFIAHPTPMDRWWVKGHSNQVGYKSIAVPSFVAVLGQAHDELGSLSWAELLQPAIDLARDGFVLNEYSHGFWEGDEEYANPLGPTKAGSPLILTDATAEILLNPNGEFRQVGEHVVLADLAHTLETVAHEGWRAFYEGDIARAMAADIETGGGLFTLDDLGTFRAKFERLPYVGTWRGFTIASPTLPSANLDLIIALQVLDGLDISSLAPNSVEYIDLIGRTMHQVYQDRGGYYADPDFQEVPVSWLCSMEHADELRERVLAREPAKATAPMARGSSYYCVVDGEGTAVGISHSWGTSSGVATPGLGFVYNNMMGTFDPRPGNHNSIEPGKCGVAGSGMLMLLRDDRVRLISGSPAGPLGGTAVLQSVVNYLVFGMPLDQAIAQPRFHTEAPDEIFLEPEIPEDVERGLRELGYRKITRSMYGGRVPIIAADETGTLEGATDPRSAGEVATA
jgi:gamma-glutamyltranspeptidase/glutathione hydrolase